VQIKFNQLGRLHMRIRHYGMWAIGSLALGGVLGYAAPRVPVQIKVLSNEQRLTIGAPSVEKNCTWRDLSAYCTSSTPETYVEKSMVVEERNGQSMRIRCTVLNRWSSCANLPVGKTFEAWSKKGALIVRYTDSRGKQHEQKYDVVDVNR